MESRPAPTQARFRAWNLIRHLRQSIFQRGILPGAYASSFSSMESRPAPTPVHFSAWNLVRCLRQPTFQRGISSGAGLSPFFTVESRPVHAPTALWERVAHHNVFDGVPLTDPVVYDYKFTTRQAIDPDVERGVVTGLGTISRRGQKARFTFTVTFQNNRGGTVAVRYEASRPDASFIIRRSPGRFEIRSR